MNHSAVWIERQKVDMGVDPSSVYIHLASKLPKNIDSTLSVGCGSGGELTHLPGKVTGLDINPKYANDNIVTGDIHDLPFEDNSFDLVWAKDTLEHVISPAMAFWEMARVAKRYVMVILPSERWADDEHHLLIPTIHQLMALSYKCNLSLLRENIYLFVQSPDYIQEFNYYLFKKVEDIK